MICQPAYCGCGIESESLTVSRSGDVFSIESMAFVICTSLTRPADPELWQHIFETDTGRFRVWDGTYWVITGGKTPVFQIERQDTFSHNSSGNELTVTLPTEVVDSDGFHTSSDGFVTIPAGLGGIYLVIARAQFASDGSGYRFIRPLLASNSTTAPAQNNGSRIGGYDPAVTANNGYPSPEIFHLEAGATVTLRAFQDTGGSLDVLGASLKGHMIQHIPSLT